ncbi:MAG: glycoside hydrolase family 97 N-terminal domain-containing protein, partial [Oscillospiraceae bacterium]|nr:glycoside hydrolase family 97 N-terminal domain-containing protein [Oscillospiraceae bacterium]
MALMLIISLSPYPSAVPVSAAAPPEEAASVRAPSNPLEISFWLDQGVPYYHVTWRGDALVEASPLGLVTDAGDFSRGLTLEKVVVTDGDETWSPVVGEKAEIRDHYNQKEFVVKNDDGRRISLVVRAYDTGVAFRYLLPEGADDYRVTREHTGFVFPVGAMAQVHVNNNQTVPQAVPVEQFASVNYQRPMTITCRTGAVVTLCEANLNNYPAMVLTKDTAARALRVKQGPDDAPVSVAGGSPAATPWRVLVVAETLKELPLHSDIVLNLNDKPNEALYRFSEWVKPGKNLMLGAGRETTETLKTWIDAAKANGLEYVLLDYGWYGPELDDRCDPRLDPAKLAPEAGDSAELAQVKLLLKDYIVADGHFDASERGFPPYGLLTGEPVWSADGWFSPDLNMPEICAYANSQGVGMILYVNGRHMFDKYGRYTPDELFARFAAWGAKGVKPGFVTVRDQMSEKRNREMIEAAARHRLILTIHDEYVTTGIERTFPNCLTTEGILGDEGIQTAEIAQDITTLFTRAIQGPTDHTFCYPGKATRGYALASSMMFRTGLNSLYWYGNPSSLASLRPEEKKFWADLPATWDELRVIEAELSSHATYARRRGNDWYLGSISAVERELQIPLDFLTPGTAYVAEIYMDEIGVSAASDAGAPLVCARYLVDSDTVLTRPMAFGTGYAARLRPKTGEDTGLPVYNFDFERLRGLVGLCGGLRETDHTVSSWAMVAPALETARQLLAAPEPAAPALRDAYTALRGARDALRSVTPLLARLGLVKCLSEHHYTPESWSVLHAAAETARALLTDPYVTQDALNTAETALAAAYGALEKKWMTTDTATYLSDLTWLPQSSSSYGPVQRDRSYENARLEVFVGDVRTTFAKGLGTHATANVYFDLEGSDYEMFEAYVAVDALKASIGAGDVIFRVYSDDVLIYESLPSGRVSNRAQKISVPIAHTKILRLEADTNGSDNSDHADWADAKFLTLKELSPETAIAGLLVDGAPLVEFAPDRFGYQYPGHADGSVPTVHVAESDASLPHRIEPAAQVPGVTRVIVTRPDGQETIYQIRFFSTHGVYLSDLNWNALDNHGSPYGTALKDRPFEGSPLLVTGPDGVNPLALPAVNGVPKGIGMHADCSVVYDIAGKGYDRFEAWVGASHTKNYNNAMVFKVFL